MFNDWTIQAFSVVVIWIYRVLVGKPEGKRPLGRTRRK